MVEEIRVVMIGKTGVGKSLLGTNILDHKSFFSLGYSQSVTTQNQRGERMFDKYCKLVLVDTPGLFGTNTKDNLETAKILASTVKQTKPGPHIFLFVVSIGRFTAEERATVEFLKDLFGSHVTNYLIIIFTGKDTLDFDNLDFEIFINTACQDLKAIVEQCQGKVAINNRASREEVTRSVDEILKLIKRVYLQNEKKYYTDKILAEAQEKYEDERKEKEKLRLQAEEAYRRERKMEDEMKNLEQDKRDDKNRIEALRKDKEEIQKKYGDERKEKEKFRLQAEEAHRRERKAEEEKKNLEQDKTDDKNKFEALRKDKEEIQKKYEDERKEKEKFRLQAEEAHGRERKMEEKMKNLELKSRDHDKDIIEEIRVVMFGKTGVGKSFLGNNILNKERFFTSRSVTKASKIGERMIGRDYKLVLVDTPGLFDTYTKDDMETAKILASTLKETRPCPHVFIFVLSIHRYTQEAKAAIGCLKDLFGSHVTDYLIIVFTGKDAIDFHDIDLETYIDKAGDDLKDLLSQCRGRVAINNRASREEVTQTVDEILQLIKRVYLLNVKQHYTDEILAEAQKKFEEELRLQEQEAHKRERELEEEKDRMNEKKYYN